MRPDHANVRRNALDFDWTNCIPTLRFMTPALVAQVDDALAQAGPFGEVRLRLVKGAVRFVDCTISQSAQVQEAL